MYHTICQNKNVETLATIIIVYAFLLANATCPGWKYSLYLEGLAYEQAEDNQ